MSDASEAARRRREIRQKKILENSGQRLGKILGAPPEAAASLAAEDGESAIRRAPAFEGAPKSAYSVSTTSEDGSGGNKQNDLLDMLLKAVDPQAENGEDPGQEVEQPSSHFLSNFLSKWFWLALGIITYVALASPDHSWMVGDSSGSVFSAAFCLHLILVRFNVISSSPPAAGRKNKNMNIDQLMILILPSLGLASQDKIHQLVGYKNHLMSFVEKWSMFYSPFLAMKLLNGVF